MQFNLSHFIAIIMTGVVVVILLFFMGFFPVSEYVFSDRFVLVDGVKNNDILNEQTYNQIKELYDKGLLSTPAELFTALTTFYDTIIIVLIVIITVFGVLAYFSVRALSHRTAEEMARNSAKDGVLNYLKSKEFHDNIVSEMSEQLGDLTEGNRKALELVDQLENIIKKGEQFISNADKSEQSEVDEEIIADDNGK
jgi:hypothetical protein